MRKIVLLSIVSIFLLVSCKKNMPDVDKVNFIESSIKSYLKIANNTDNGTIAIQSASTFGTTAPKAYTLNASFVNKKAEVLDIDGRKFFATGTNTFMSTDKSLLSAIFGKKVNIAIQADTTSLQTRESNIFDMPDEINVYEGDNPTRGTSGSQLPRNTSLNWNGLNNGRNVLILIDFDPEKSGNESYSSSNPVRRFYEVPDNGRFLVTDTELAGIPTGAFVSIVVVRGNAALIGGSTNGQASSIYAYSSATIVIPMGP